MANLRILHGCLMKLAAIKKGTSSYTNNNPSLLRFPTVLNYHSNSYNSYDDDNDDDDDSDRIRGFINVFDDMIQTRPLPPVEVFNFLLHNLVAEKTNYSSTIGLDRFKRMSAVGIPINTSTAKSVIKFYCQLQQTEHSFTVLGCCLKQGIVPPADVSIYNTILDGFIRQDRTHEAERLFKKMFIFNKNNNNELNDQLPVCSKPDIVTYNTMLKGLCKVRDNVTAIALLKLMDGRGGCCKPDIVSYNTVIDGLCSDPGVVITIDDALKLFNEMVFIKGIRPDADTYKSLIYAFSKLGHWDEVCMLLKRMEVDENIELDLKIFNIMVDALCKQNKLKEARGVFIFMHENGYHPNIATYNSFIQMYCSRGQMDIAWKLFCRLRKNGMKPNSVTYNTLLDGLFLQNLEKDFTLSDGFIKNLEEELARIDIFYIMRNHLLNKVTHFLLSQVLITCTNHHHYHPSKLLEYRDDISDYPDAVYIKFNYLYHLYMYGDSFDQALDLFNFMGGHKLNSNIEVYNILIFGANNCGRFDVARKLFHELTVKHLEPDEVTYTLIIRGFCKQGLVKDAKTMFVEMKRAGFLRGVVEMNQLPLCYLEEDNFKCSAWVFHDMHERNTSIQEETLYITDFLKSAAGLSKCPRFATPP